MSKSDKPLSPEETTNKLNQIAEAYVKDKNYNFSEKSNLQSRLHTLADLAESTKWTIAPSNIEDIKSINNLYQKNLNEVFDKHPELTPEVRKQITNVIESSISEIPQKNAIQKINNKSLEDYVEKDKTLGNEKLQAIIEKLSKISKESPDLLKNLGENTTNKYVDKISKVIENYQNASTIEQKQNRLSEGLNDLYKWCEKEQKATKNYFGIKKLASCVKSLYDATKAFINNDTKKGKKHLQAATAEIAEWRKGDKMLKNIKAEIAATNKILAEVTNMKKPLTKSRSQSNSTISR